jgi:hypothetical protein
MRDIWKIAIIMVKLYRSPMGSGTLDGDRIEILGGLQFWREKMID